jgi:capsid protein
MFERLKRRLGKFLGFDDPKRSRTIDLEALEAFRARWISGRYESAQQGDEYRNIWGNTDWFDADSAHSIDVRKPLVWRSRYEVANNGFSDGIAQTYATDMVGPGPKLRMMTASLGFNQMVETTWQLWAQKVSLRRKLWCMCHAKHVDGEGFGLMMTNPAIDFPIQLDIKLRETDQCTTPFVPFTDPTYIDGIKFDEFGNPLHYDFLKFHPGSKRPVDFTYVPDQIPAQYVLHWYKMRRPNQHRGVPESSSTLNLGAAARRYREANLSTAEKVAEFTLFLKTIFQPEELATVKPMSTLDIQHGMLTALPNNVEPFQVRAEHPPATYDTFHKTLINEQARPKSMPLNKAMCNSADYNYASGRLDHQTYYAEIDFERLDCDELVLEKLFGMWFKLAIKNMGWLKGDPFNVSPFASLHSFDWPAHQVADVEAEANANKTRLSSGQVGLDALYTEYGEDLEEMIPKMAETFGVTEDELRRRLFDVILAPPKTGPTSPPGAKPPIPPFAASERFAKSNGNGVVHADS